MSKINLQEKFALFDDIWSPKVVGESNGQLVKIAKGDGELVWHKHDNEDELFLVIKGKLTLQLRDQNIELNPGEIYIVPKGVEHCPVAEPNTHFLMIEPATTKHTGEHKLDLTVAAEDQSWI